MTAKQGDDLTVETLERIKKLLIDPIVDQMNVAIRAITDPTTGYVPRPEIAVTVQQFKDSHDRTEKRLNEQGAMLWSILAGLLALIALAIKNALTGGHG